jgi:hypothetical protein
MSESKATGNFPIPMRKIGNTPTAANVRFHKQEPGTRTSALDVPNPLTEYNPELERYWVRAPHSRDSTVSTRREWFRVMHFNVTADTFSTHEKYAGTPFIKTPPAADLIVKAPPRRLKRGKYGEPVPAEGELEPGADPAVYMDWNNRQRRFIDEVLYYDPDILTVNEMTRAQFDGPVWRAIRMQGYGGMFQSNRRNGRLLPKGESLSNPKYSEGYVPHECDVGSAIYFHKGRFFANMIGGEDLPKSIPFLMMAGLKDRAAGNQVLMCLLSLTPGSSEVHVAQREYEIQQMLTALEPVRTRTSEAFHQALMFQGDFNCESEDEPCVQLLRDKFPSAYDFCGGPRWTTWYHTTPPAPEEAAKLIAEANAVSSHSLEAFVAQLPEPSIPTPSPDTPPEGAAQAGADSAKAESAPTTSTPAETSAEAPGGTSSTPPPAAPVARPDAEETDIEDEAQHDEDSLQAGGTRGAPLQPVGHRDKALLDTLTFEQVRALQLCQGIVKKTSDFMFFDSSRLSVLQALDIPADESVDPVTLLPCPKHPFHHMHLVADFCWNTFDVDTAPNKGPYR